MGLGPLGARLDRGAGGFEGLPPLRGVEPVGAHHLHPGGRDVEEEALEEFYDREAHRLRLRPARGVGLPEVAVAEAHLLPVEGPEALVLHRAALEVAGEVGRHPLAVVVGGFQAHIPLPPAGSGDDPEGLLAGEIGRQQKLTPENHGLERVAEALPEAVAHLAPSSDGFQGWRLRRLTQDRGELAGVTSVFPKSSPLKRSGSPRWLARA